MTPERPEPCPRVSRICDQLFLGGLGGLSSFGIEVLLQSYAVTHLVLCGRPDKDDHVSHAQLAVESSGTTELHLAPLVPEDPKQVLQILEEAVQFIQEALEDDLNNVLVACSKGASRSVVVLLSYLLTTTSSPSCHKAFDSVAACRWRIWPSALLVQSLLEMQRRQVVPDADTAWRFCRRVGCHAAWATAWHNGQAVSYAEAERAWDDTEDVALEEKFAACKQSLLGKSAGELAMYTDQPPPETLPPHAEVTDLGCNLMLCGLGGLSEKQIAALLTSHGMQRVILCGKPGRDAHVTALQKALPLAGLSGSDMYLIPVSDSAAEDLGAHFKAAVDFTVGLPKTLVACRQGASRSATVAAACLMSQRKVTAAEGLKQIYAKRWRVWPNPGFVLQLLSYERHGSKKAGDPADAESEALLEMVGIRSAWAANQQNLQETGFGQKDVTMEKVASFWKQACTESSDVQRRFERCKELTLGVDLDAFGGDGEDGSKRRRVEVVEFETQAGCGTANS